MVGRWVLSVVNGNPVGGGSLLPGATSAAGGNTWVVVAVSVGTTIGGAPAGEPDPGVVMGLDASVFCRIHTEIET